MKEIVFTNNLAIHWEGFVNCFKRSKTMIPYLISHMPTISNPRVIDLAAGVGCETKSLAELGYEIVANEIEPGMREIASAFSRKFASRIQWVGVDWRNLSVAFDKEKFHYLLLLGNSFCLLHSEQDRIRVAQEIYCVCAPGGRLVIDERNFRYILSNRTLILNDNFRYSGNVVFCGEEIVGYPISISDHHIRFAYKDVSDGAIIGHLDMWPFRSGEIQQIFEGVGFSFRSIASDLRAERNEKADFYTYVFEKPL